MNSQTFAPVGASVSRKALLTAFLTLTAMLPALASADGANAASTGDIYRKYATIPTEVPGIFTFAEPPQGFNPVSATDEELAMYGFPPRPDQTSHPQLYRSWEFSVKAAKTRWKGPLKVTQLSNSVPSVPAAHPSVVDRQIPDQNPYWAGFGNYKNISVYDSKKGSLSSIYAASAIFTVPTVKDANGVSGCSSLGAEGTVEAEVGIDAPTLEGGVIAQNPGWIDFGGCFVYSPVYYAEIGGGTTNAIIEVFPVSPGDIMTVTVWDTSATTGYVFLFDSTSQAGTTYAITTNPIVGNSVDFLLARIYLNGVLDQLPNYVADLWTQAYAVDFSDKVYGPGTDSAYSTSYLETVLWEMTDDAGDQLITYSVPYTQSFGNSYVPDTSYGIFFNVSNCAWYYGCTP